MRLSGKLSFKTAQLLWRFLFSRKIVLSVRIPMETILLLISSKSLLYILTKMGFGAGSDPQMDFVGNIPCLPIYFLKNSIWCCMDARKFLFVWVLCSALFVHQSTNTSDNFIGVLMALGALRNLKMGTGGVCPVWIVLPLNRFFGLNSITPVEVKP